MKTKYLLKIFLLTGSIAFAGESQFGLVNNSLGNLILPYSTSGTGRSYEMAHLDSVQLNLRNIATSTDISHTTFTFGLGYNGIWGENRIEKTFIDNANFQGGRLAIPVMEKKLVFSMGLQPYTSIEQRIVSNTATDTIPVTENLFIRGGLSRANFNFAYKFSPELSVSLGYEYTFGKISENAVIKIDDDLSTKINLQYDN